MDFPSSAKVQIFLNRTKVGAGYGMGRGGGILTPENVAF